MADRELVYKNQIRISSDDFDAAMRGCKICTIRRGIASVKGSEIDLTDGRRRLRVLIRQVDTSKKFGQLGIEEVRGEGFETTEELRADLVRYYPNLRDDQSMTVIWFELPQVVGG